MKENKINILTRLGCFLIGWNPNILKECGEASHRTLKRYVSAILILIIIWGTIGFFFADNFFGVKNLFGQIVISLTFITIIISIERFILLTVGKLGFMGVVRVFLAILMAVLGSAIFDQIIFRNDINVQMHDVRTEQINKEITKQLLYMDADIKRTTNLIDSIGKANIEIYEKLDKKPMISTTDVTTSTRQNGVDKEGKPIIEKTTNISKHNVANPLINQAKANEEALQLYKIQLDTYQKEKMNIAKNVREKYEKAETGFLEELGALISILKANPIALTFYIFLFLFLMSLELLVVSSKSGDSKCDYDLIVERQLKIKSETLKKTEEHLIIKGRE